MADIEKIKVAYQKAYGDYWETKFTQDMEARSKDNANEKDEQKLYAGQVQEAETKSMDEPPVYTAPETEQVQEAPVAEQAAPAPQKEEKSHLVTPNEKVKDSYPSLFSMFSEMLGGDGKQGGDDELTAMFVLAFSALLDVDAFKERLEEAERALEEMRKREREKEAAEVEKAPASAEKEPVVYDTEPVQPEKKVEKAADVQQAAPEVSPERPKGGISLTDMAEVRGVDVSQIKLRTPADMAYDNIAKGKEQVTLADLQQAGVNLKTDLQPTLKALTKDNPNKLSELAPKGLGDENAPVSKEFATALIARAQQRETIARHNSLSR